MMILVLAFSLLQTICFAQEEIPPVLVFNFDNNISALKGKDGTTDLHYDYSILIGVGFERYLEKHYIDSDLSIRFGSESVINAAFLSWNYYIPYNHKNKLSYLLIGNTTYSFDFIGNMSLMARAGIGYRFDRFKVYLLTGYDFLQKNIPFTIRINAALFSKGLLSSAGEYNSHSRHDRTRRRYSVF